MYMLNFIIYVALFKMMLENIMHRQNKNIPIENMEPNPIKHNVLKNSKIQVTREG